MFNKSIDVSGVWTGLCHYDSAAESVSTFPADFRGVPFDMTLRHGWFGRLSGEIRDDPKFSDSEPARIRGSVRNAILDFFMTRRNSSVMFEGRIVPLSKYVRTHWNADIEWSSPHPVANYRGELNANGKRISGVWWIAASTTLVRIKGIIYELPECPETSGTWEVTRK